VRINENLEKKMVRKETRAYQSMLEAEINQDREEHGKKPSLQISFKIKRNKKRLRKARQILRAAIMSKMNERSNLRIPFMLYPTEMALY